MYPPNVIFSSPIYFTFIARHFLLKQLSKIFPLQKDPVSHQFEATVLSEGLTNHLGMNTGVWRQNTEWVGVAVTTSTCMLKVLISNPGTNTDYSDPTTSRSITIHAATCLTADVLKLPKKGEKKRLSENIYILEV
jgi:hypothetical protein